MIGEQRHTASLRLDPPELGPLQVVLTINNDQANAAFFATEPEVRRAIEAAMPRLREMLDAAGIQLGDATVGAGTSSNDNPSPGAKHLSENGPGDGPDEAGSVPAIRTEVRTVSRGLVDTFA
jgi:flagellar hook-length control protein FliK